MNKVGRYVIISELGRGAMGIVYKASDPTIGREVALKVLVLSASQEEGTNSPQEMFMREVRAAGRLTHPSIVTIHDAFEDPVNKTSCIVMELVPGMTLEKILDSGHTLTIDQSLYIIRQVVEGLDYAHRNQVIHRDLKPANILVTQDGRAKITDFGIAKVLAREGMARTVGMMGTPSYMSPEQVKGGELDGRTDIFSLGIIIYTMLTGKKPFVGNTAAVMFKIVYEEPEVPSSLNPQLTPAHDYVIGKCLAKERDQRYATARELLGDVDDLQHGRPPRSQKAAPAPATSPAPSATPPAARTPIVPVPGTMKGAAPPPVARPVPPPPPRAAAQPPKPATPSPTSPVGAGGAGKPSQTVRMAIPDIIKEVSRPPTQGVVSVPPAQASVPVQPPKSVTPSPVTPTLHPDAQPLTGKTLPMRVPDLSLVSSSAPGTPTPEPLPPAAHKPTLLEQTVPAAPPKAPSGSPPAKPSAPLPLNLPASPLMERTGSIPVPDLSAAFQAAGPQPRAVETPPQLETALMTQAPELPAAASRAPKSLFFSLMFGGATVALLGVVTWGYWKFHRPRPAPSPLPQVAVQTAPATPSPVPTPEAPSTTPPAPAVEQPAPPVSAPTASAPAVSPPPAVTKKTTVHKPKPAAAQQPVAPEPAPPPPEPAAAPPPPSPPTPSPEEIARAEAARLANIPRIVQVLCNYGLKEATFIFSSSGQPLFQETLKGKRKKEGFLGIKGSYQGTFTRTITVPAGVSEISIHVVSRDGELDAIKAIKMPPPGGFVPTLVVEVDSDHMVLDWKSSK